MSANLQQLMRQIEGLSSEELTELRRRVNVIGRETPGEEFDRRLYEMGLVSTPRLPRDPNRPINPTPLAIQGKPLSESLIEERR